MNIAKKLFILLLLISGCKTTTKQESEDSVFNSFETDKEICKGIDSFAREKAFLFPDSNGLEIFELKKQDEEALLTDLIRKYYEVATEFQRQDPNSQQGAVNSSYDICSDPTLPKAYKGVIPEPEEIKTLADAESVITLYCDQKKSLKSCKYSRAKTKLCVNWTKSRPSWVTDACEITHDGIKGTLTGAAGQFCGFLANASLDGEPDVACGSKIISTVCALHYKAASTVETELNRYRPKDEPLKNRVASEVTKTFVSAALSCAASLGVNSLKEAILNDPAGSLAEFGVRRIDTALSTSDSMIWGESLSI
jgi:hypothetical protein